MIFCVLVALFLFGLTKLLYEHGEDMEDRLVALFGFSVFYCGVSAMVLFFLEPIGEQEYKRVNYGAAIYSLSIKDTLSGNFTIGSGYVSSQEAYFYFTKDSRGGFCRGWVYASDASIFQKDNETPQITNQKVYYRTSKWIIPWNHESRIADTRYDLIVPMDTIVQRFGVR